LKDHNCSLQEGDICEVTFESASEAENETYWCYNTMDAQELLCGRQNLILPISRTLRCQVCAVGSFEDMEDEVGKISGTLYWGRNAIDGEIDESLVDGYDVWLVDSCGEQYLHVTRVTKLNWIQENGCCDPAAYNYTFGILDMPQESMLIMLPCCHVCDTYSCFSSGTYELHDYALQGRLLGFQLDNSDFR